jgi:ATP-dependent protease ClpP protease subunit/FtsZ-binding cell division protein ZapB
VKTAKINILTEIGAHPSDEALKEGANPTFSADDMRNFIKDNSDADVFEVLLSTVGGSVNHGIDIYNQLKQLIKEGKKVKTIAVRADSIGSIVFLAGQEREVMDNITDMTIHFPFLPGEAIKNENLTSEMLKEITDDIISAESQILNIYKNELQISENEFSEVEALMKKETNLKASGALKYGFATALVKNIIASKSECKAIAYTDKIAALLNNQNNMNPKEINSKFEKLENWMKNLFKAQNLNEDGTPIVQNTTATAADGTVMYFTESTLAVGVAVFTDEAMSTPAPDGTYQVDGNDVSVSGGIVTQVETIEDKSKTEMENLKNENEGLKSELENLKAENSTLKASSEAIVNEVKSFKDEIENLKKVIPNDVKNLKDLPAPELTPAQKHLQNRKKFN